MPPVPTETSYANAGPASLPDPPPPPHGKKAPTLAGFWNDKAHSLQAVTRQAPAQQLPPSGPGSTVPASTLVDGGPDYVDKLKALVTNPDWERLPPKVHSAVLAYAANHHDKVAAITGRLPLFGEIHDAEACRDRQAFGKWLRDQSEGLKRFYADFYQPMLGAPLIDLHPLTLERRIDQAIQRMDFVKVGEIAKGVRGDEALRGIVAAALVKHAVALQSQSLGEGDRAHKLAFCCAANLTVAMAGASDELGLLLSQMSKAEGELFAKALDGEQPRLESASLFDRFLAALNSAPRTAATSAIVHNLYLQTVPDDLTRAPGLAHDMAVAKAREWHPDDKAKAKVEAARVEALMQGRGAKLLFDGIAARKAFVLGAARSESRITADLVAHDNGDPARNRIVTNAIAHVMIATVRMMPFGAAEEDAAMRLGGILSIAAGQQLFFSDKVPAAARGQALAVIIAHEITSATFKTGGNPWLAPELAKPIAELYTQGYGDDTSQPLPGLSLDNMVGYAMGIAPTLPEGQEWRDFLKGVDGQAVAAKIAAGEPVTAKDLGDAYDLLTRYLSTASHMIGYTKDNPNINLPDAINQGIRRLDNEITVQTHKHYELLDTGASPEAIEFCARDLREIMTLKMLLEEQRAAFIEGNFLRSGGPINEIELQNLWVTAEKEIAKLQDLTTPLNVDQLEPARAALHKYNEAVKKAGEHAPAEHTGALKDLTEKLAGLHEKAPTPSIGDTLRDTLRPEVVAKMDAAIRDSGARAEALDVKRAQRRGPTDIDLARGRRLAEQAMNAAKDPRSSGDERQNALESILDFLDEVNLGDDHAPKAHQDLAKKLNIALDALEDFGGPLDMSDKEIDDVLNLHRHDKIAAAGRDLRALRPPTPKSLRSTLPPDIAKMDAEILGRDKAAELFDRKIAPDQPGPNLAKLREAAVKAMLGAENIVSVEEFDEAIEPVLDYLEEVDSPDAHVPQVHQDLAESLGKKLAAIQIARGDDDSNIDMIKEIGYSDPHFTENPPRQSSARGPERAHASEPHEGVEGHRKNAAEAYEEYRRLHEHELSPDEKQELVKLLNLKPGISNDNLVFLNRFNARLDFDIMNLNRQIGEMAGKATQEAIDEKTEELHTMMASKMVIEEEIAKYHDSLN